MNMLILFGAIITLACGAPQFKPSETDPELARLQNQSARYSFSTDIDDKISDLEHQRTEVRDGLNVKGRYSYSDGYVKHIVHYEADDKGYRITKQDIIPLDNGPQVNPLGTASIATNSHGKDLNYRIKSVPIQEYKYIEQR